MTSAPLLLGPAGRFLLDPAARTLHLDAQPAALGARALEVLIALAEASGELVTKEQLLQRCWHGLVVEEANVHVQVSQLRKVLGAQAIATVPGLGYRFAWPLRRAGAQATPHNLPAPRTPFIGRTALLDEARLRLSGTRLLTLIGIGGTGKTRLALQLAQQARADFADGTWWIDLAPLDQAAQVAASVAQALGITSQSVQDGADALPGWLHRRRLLLLLDNCEHLLDEVARLADTWLAAAPQLMLLVTSREALSLAGEVVLPVAPMALPEAGATPHAVLACDAVQLFIDRAAAAAPGLALGTGDAQALAEICRRVDGIPLALELAAAQLRVVSPAQLLDLLQERFRLLTSQRRALPRQQTMQAVMRWSYEHLRSDEQRLLMALATCSGGCDLHAAAALIGDEMTRVALLSGLSRLAEQSLLVVQHGSGDARYHLLETVRQFAFDRLQEGDDGTTLRARHAAHYLALAEACADDLVRTGDGAGPIARLDAERGNLLRAIDACLHEELLDGAAMGLRILAALRRFWMARGLGRMGADLGLAALARAQALPPDRSRVIVAYVTAYLLWCCRRLDEAHRVALQATQVAEAVGDRVGLASSHLELGSVLHQLGRHDEGQAQHETACRVALQAGDHEIYADTLCRMGNEAAVRGRLQQATAYFDEALPIRLASRQGWRVAGVLQFAANLAIELGDARRARELLRRAAVELPRVGAAQYERHLLDFSVRLAQLEGDWPLVARLSATSSALDSPSSSYPSLGFDTSARQALLQRARAALGSVAFDAAWASGQKDNLAQAVAYTVQWLNDDDPAAA